MKGNEGFSPLFQDDPYGVAAEPAPERPIGDHPCALEHHDAVAGSLDFGEQVGVEEVVPAASHSCTSLRTSARPVGSSAEVGSSRSNRRGQPTRATANPRRCCIPLEKLPTLSPALSARPTSASTR